MFTSSTAERSPFPSRGRTMRRSLGRDFECRAFAAIADFINSAVIVLSKTVDVGRDHLIHRMPLRGSEELGINDARYRRKTSRIGLFIFKRSAKGSGSAGHLIHRGAVPLPLKGKDKKALDKGSILSLLERVFSIDY